MNDLSERQEAFENKFKHDEELRFKIQSYAVELFGIWAAKQLKFSDAKIKEYADSVIEFNIESTNPKALGIKIQKDLKDAGIEKTEEELATQLNNNIEESKKKLMG